MTIESAKSGPISSGVAILAAQPVESPRNGAQNARRATRRSARTVASSALALLIAMILKSAASEAAEGPTQGATGASEATTIEEVVVTGSSIKQNLDDSPLPITIMTAADISKTGFTSATDLLQNLPALQGFVPASSSVNGGGGGVTTAALHSLPSKYTLVLIDGQRVAPFTLGAVQGGGFGVNIESIPLDAVERVEVLTDGASALYGADAIAGVVNFILKKNKTDGDAYYNVSVPQAPGGGGWNAGLSKGFGSLNEDGYNVLLTFSHDYQDSLQASQRDVSKRGAYFPFSSGGNNYFFNAATSNTEPANVTIGSLGVSYNPFYQLNGNCGGQFGIPLATSTGLTCRFNYGATVQDIPSSVRNSGMLKGTFKVADNSTLWVEVLASRFDLVAQYAPPAQPLVTSPTRLPALWNAYVVPYLTANNETATNATLNYRAVSAGGRADDWGTAARHIAVGWNGSYSGWDVNATAVASHGKLVDTPTGGYVDYAQLSSAVASGQYDPVLGSGASSIQSAILHSDFSVSNSDLLTLTAGAQHEVLTLPGGPSVLSIGAEYDDYKYKVNYSNLILSQSGFSTQPSSNDYPVGGGYGAIPFEADRANWGLFGEWEFPIEKNLNVNASVRYDSYAKVHSNEVFSAVASPTTGLQEQIAPADLGNSFDATTYKVSFRYTPIEMLSFRGSYGTGFKVPNLTDISGALAFLGSTSGTYACPFPGSPGCLPGSAQYDLLAGANGASGASGLKPEKSTQWTLGARIEPMPALSLAFDYWNVSVKNQIESAGIAEQVAFNNPSAYAYLFINPYNDPSGFQTIGFEQIPFNGGVAHYAGVDWTFTYHMNLGWGALSAAWTGTRMLTQNYTNGPGMPTLTDLGVYGPDQQVVFRTISNLILSLESGRWTNTLTAHYKSGYLDEPYSAGSQVVFTQNASGGVGTPVDFAGLSVPAFTTVDWQTTFAVTSNAGVALGVRNITDKAPPMSLQTGGGGNQIGYDARYYDPTGRTWYLRANVKF